MIYVIGPRDKAPDCTVINVTSRSKDFGKKLSPFFLGPVRLYDKFVSKNVENAWQFSKLYPQHADEYGFPTKKYWMWAQKGWNDHYAHRYPMGKGKKPLHAWWNGEKLDYISSRKKIYLPLYWIAAHDTYSFRYLCELYAKRGKIALWDFDGYDYLNLDMSLEDVLNDPKRKMGHAFVLAMMLQRYVDDFIGFGPFHYEHRMGDI